MRDTLFRISFALQRRLTPGLRYSQDAYEEVLARQVTADVRWLDVGCGYGHFAKDARPVLPDTRFDGLDFGASVDDAALGLQTIAGRDMMDATSADVAVERYADAAAFRQALAYVYQQ